MGLVYAEIDLISIDDVVLHRRGFLDKDKIKQVRVDALVDSGAYMLSINENVRAQLDLPIIEKQFAMLADDTLIEVDVVGPVEVRLRTVALRLTRLFCQVRLRFCSARSRWRIWMYSLTRGGKN